MYKYKIFPVFQAILAAILFGVSAPLSKVLLGNIEPVPLASFLYLGSGTGMLLFQLIQHFILKQDSAEAPVSKKDISWLLGAVIFGGVLAPIILLTSLRITPASTASLLLNFEGVATTIIALIVFRENVGKRVGAAVGLITLSSIILSWDFSNQWGFSMGALGVVSACVCWGIDNNLTRNISSKNPFIIVTIKGIGAGLFSLFLSFLLKSHMPDIKLILGAMILGFFSYGFSIVLFVFAMRSLGSARTSAFFGTAPFIGTILSLLLFRSTPGVPFIIAFPIIFSGTILLLKDKHEHEHLHEALKHEHKHSHNDGHHNHVHESISSSDITHSHAHTHESLVHTHPHTPDTHHRHIH
jgi:Permeases of the drug/metabolite transporter (DMT) superfamily